MTEYDYWELRRDMRKDDAIMHTPQPGKPITLSPDDHHMIVSAMRYAQGRNNNYVVRRTTRFVIDQPVHLDVVFVMPARKREPDPGGWHTATPDLDKLIRAIGDALTMAGILHDDSRIAAITATKRRARHGEPPGAHIHLDTLERNPNANKEEVPR
ncbi:RusA family crossover junction endodeoxyribonuclease [Corynebacterium striatum]